jgi:hypothetical protein
MLTHMRKLTIEVFGVIRRNKREPKDTWWWNDNVQKTINEKKECYKHLHHHMSDENIYRSTKKLKKNAMKTMSEASGKAYVKLYRKLDIK